MSGASHDTSTLQKVCVLEMACTRILICMSCGSSPLEISRNPCVYNPLLGVLTMAHMTTQPGQEAQVVSILESPEDVVSFHGNIMRMLVPYS